MLLLNHVLTKSKRDLEGQHTRYTDRVLQLNVLGYRSLTETNAAFRISMAGHLANLVSLVDQPKPSQSSSGLAMWQIKTIPSGICVIARLLDGPEEEVKRELRRRAYTVLTQVIKHDTNPALEGIDHTSKIIFEGIRDVDRSVRLSAG